MVHNEIHTIDLLIIAAYLIAMVLIGLVVVRKVRNMDDYYLGGRSFGPLVLMATVCATIIGGSGRWDARVWRTRAASRRS